MTIEREIHTGLPALSLRQSRILFEKQLIRLTRLKINREEELNSQGIGVLDHSLYIRFKDLQDSGLLDVARKIIERRLPKTHSQTRQSEPAISATPSKKEAA